MAVYTRLAEAESRVHGVTVDGAVLHELGNPDTAADIIGVCAAIADLNLERITCGPVAVGAGTMQAAHGELTVPGPAVADLLQGFVVHGGARAKELTTPTGAALVAVLTTPVESMPAMRLSRHGRGAGSSHDEGRSMLTVLVGEAAEVADASDPDGFYIVETTVDDLQPEFVTDVLDRARSLPATRDSWATPVLMKKGRPGFTLSVLVRSADGIAAVRDVLFHEAGTLGVRWYPVAREALERRWVVVAVDGVAIEVKLAGPPDAPVRIAPEHDDVASAALVLGRPVREVHEAAAAAVRAGEGEPTEDRRS